MHIVGQSGYQATVGGAVGKDQLQTGLVTQGLSPHQLGGDRSQWGTVPPHDV
jgi:hypothetical protein